jgi:hydrogenase maturation factor
MSSAPNEPECSAEPGCITCGDVAVALTVTGVAGSDASCIDPQGHEEWVATELVGQVRPGDRVLVHAGVALERLAAGV